MRLKTSTKRNDVIIKYATFTYGRNGKLESKFVNVLKPKPNVKNDHDAKIIGYLNEDGKWVIQILNFQHNHELSPDKVMYFSCNCRISASAKN